MDVIIESTDLATVLVQDGPGMTGSEVFPVQERFGEEPGGRGDVGIDEGIVAFATHASMPVADVVRVVEQAFAVRPDIEHGGNHARRIDTRGSGVDGKLANGNLDATDAPIADTEDLFRVGGHEQIDVVGSRALGATPRFGPFRMRD